MKVEKSVQITLIIAVVVLIVAIGVFSLFSRIVLIWEIQFQLTETLKSRLLQIL